MKRHYQVEAIEDYAPRAPGPSYYGMKQFKLRDLDAPTDAPDGGYRAFLVAVALTDAGRGYSDLAVGSQVTISFGTPQAASDPTICHTCGGNGTVMRPVQEQLGSCDPDNWTTCPSCGGTGKTP